MTTDDRMRLLEARMDGLEKTMAVYQSELLPTMKQSNLYAEEIEALMEKLKRQMTVTAAVKVLVNRLFCPFQR